MIPPWTGWGIKSKCCCKVVSPVSYDRDVLEIPSQGCTTILLEDAVLHVAVGFEYEGRLSGDTVGRLSAYCANCDLRISIST